MYFFSSKSFVNRLRFCQAMCNKALLTYLLTSSCRLYLAEGPCTTLELIFLLSAIATWSRDPAQHWSWYSSCRLCLAEGPCPTLELIFLLSAIATWPRDPAQHWSWFSSCRLYLVEGPCTTLELIFLLSVILDQGTLHNTRVDIPPVGYTWPRDPAQHSSWYSSYRLNLAEGPCTTLELIFLLSAIATWSRDPAQHWSWYSSCRLCLAEGPCPTLELIFLLSAITTWPRDPAQHWSWFSSCRLYLVEGPCTTLELIFLLSVILDRGTLHNTRVDIPPVGYTWPRDRVFAATIQSQ